MCVGWGSGSCDDLAGSSGVSVCEQRGRDLRGPYSSQMLGDGLRLFLSSSLVALPTPLLTRIPTGMWPSVSSVPPSLLPRLAYCPCLKGCCSPACVCAAWQFAGSYRQSPSIPPQPFLLLPPPKISFVLVLLLLPPFVTAALHHLLSNHPPIHILLSIFLFLSLPACLPPPPPSPSPPPRLGSGAGNRCCLLLIWVRSD